MADVYRTLAEPGTSEYKDRGSKFLAYAFPVETEEAALAHVAMLRKEHPKANHHCFAWRLGVEGQRFRANDDGEPSGTAGRPILGQIDAAGLTNVVVVVVRYFGGTLLGTSGLLQAYRESAAEALRNAPTVERTVFAEVRAEIAYALLPEWTSACKRTGIEILHENYSEAAAAFTLGIPRSQVEQTLQQLKAYLWKTTSDEARTLPWPDGIVLERQV
ncbi:MAG: YigZ family protein [Saprospiraceae bacterium]|nr:IMPACT family protein [Saprospiraceae bacterium]MDW8228543.1 YigZ family protein [Saprospiraceae bacterium]